MHGYNLYSSMFTFETNTSTRIIVTLNNIIMPEMPYWALGESSSNNPIGVRAIDAIIAP